MLNKTIPKEMLTVNTAIPTPSNKPCVLLLLPFTLLMFSGERGVIVSKVCVWDANVGVEVGMPDGVAVCSVVVKLSACVGETVVEEA